jgi:DNA-binding MarR family transcriptional regulator
MNEAAIVLEEQGLARQTRDPGDRRRLLLSLTQPGRKEAERVTTIFALAEGTVLRALTRRERQRLPQLAAKPLPQTGVTAFLLAGQSRTRPA